MRIDLTLWVAQLLGKLSGNKYKRIKGILYVQHPHRKRKWEPLREHIEDQRKLRENR